MSHNIFFISDTHFSHKRICEFIREDGITPVRHWNDVEQMNEDLISNWNSVVKTNDKVYHLGDVCMNKRNLNIVERLNGNKELILGNHDSFHWSEYTKYFKNLHGTLKVDSFILTHVPIHIDSITNWCLANIHGHIHEKVINHHKYFNVSVENINYTPISIEDLKSKILKNLAIDSSAQVV